MRLLLDENVLLSVRKTFMDCGHEVLLVRDLLPVGSADPLVATIAEIEAAILVSCDHDFKKIAPRIPKGQRTRFRKLSRLSLRCRESRASERVRAAMSFIEREYEEAPDSKDKRMIVEISETVMRTIR
jgi:predicted nuclease of predicted toxin-antitoxin system